MFACAPNPWVRELDTCDGRWITGQAWWFSWRGEQHEPIERDIPAGFVTDWASIPRFYRWRFSPTGKHSRAALAHDFLYREAIVPRAVCDQVFLDAMEALGVGWWSRHVMHKAVRLGGWASYGKGDPDHAAAA